MEPARWLRTVRAGDLEIDGRTIGAGFVKLSEEEMEKRRKTVLASNATRRATIAEIVESLGASRIRKDTGRTRVTKDQIWYKSGELKTDFSPE